MSIRLDKWLSNQGIGSRNEVNAMIRAGRVRVNGVMATLPKMKIDLQDRVTFDQDEIPYVRYRYFMLNKPEGIISATKDRHETVMDRIRPEDQAGHRLFPVGRLDRDTTGLLLISDDGRLAHALLSPAHHVEKEYRVLLDRPIESWMIERFREGLRIPPDSEDTLPATLEALPDHCGRVIIVEGRYHQVKRMFEAVGRKVLKLERRRMGPLTLDKNLELGAYRALTEEEISSLFDAAGLNREEKSAFDLAQGARTGLRNGKQE